MPNLSLIAAVEKNKLNGGQPWLIALEIFILDPETNTVAQTVRIVQNSEAVTLNGDVFSPVPFTIDSKSAPNELPEVNVTISDSTQTLQSYMQNYRGGVGSKVRVMILIGSDPANMTVELDLSEVFVIRGASSSDYVVTWRLGADNPLSVKAPRRVQSSNACPWLYRDVRCKYAGALPTCDLTFSGSNGCKVHQNEENFGGFPAVVNL